MHLRTKRTCSIAHPGCTSKCRPGRIGWRRSALRHSVPQIILRLFTPHFISKLWFASLANWYNLLPVPTPNNQQSVIFTHVSTLYVKFLATLTILTTSTPSIHPFNWTVVTHIAQITLPIRRQGILWIRTHHTYYANVSIRRGERESFLLGHTGNCYYYYSWARKLNPTSPSTVGHLLVSRD